MSATAIDKESTQETANKLAMRLPDPVGYKMLVVKPDRKSTRLNSSH